MHDACPRHAQSSLLKIEYDKSMDLYGATVTSGPAQNIGILGGADLSEYTAFHDRPRWHPCRSSGQPVDRGEDMRPVFEQLLAVTW